MVLASQVPRLLKHTSYTLGDRSIGSYRMHTHTHTLEQENKKHAFTGMFLFFWSVWPKVQGSPQSSGQARDLPIPASRPGIGAIHPIYLKNRKGGGGTKPKDSRHLEVQKSTQVKKRCIFAPPQPIIINAAQNAAPSFCLASPPLQAKSPHLELACSMDTQLWELPLEATSGVDCGLKVMEGSA
jgi:hypothetical protein